MENYLLTNMESEHNNQSAVDGLVTSSTTEIITTDLSERSTPFAIKSNTQISRHEYDDTKSNTEISDIGLATDLSQNNVYSNTTTTDDNEQTSLFKKNNSTKKNCDRVGIICVNNNASEDVPAKKASNFSINNDEDLILRRNSDKNEQKRSKLNHLSKIWHERVSPKRDVVPKIGLLQYFGRRRMDDVEGQKVNGKFQIRGVRYVVLITAVLCMAATRANDASFNFTFICMTSNLSINNDDPLKMTSAEASLLFGGSGLGVLSMVFPVVFAIHHLGPRIVFTSLLSISAIASIMIPNLARISPIWALPARFVHGVTFSSVLPMMGCVSAQWAPRAEISKFMTLLSGANQVAQIISIPMSAQLCVISGWSSVFRVHGIVALMLACIFFIVFRRTPHQHPAVRPEELHYITAGAKARNKQDAVPYLRIFRTKSVWAVWIAFLGNSFGFQLIVQFMPTFLNKVLGLPIRRTGFAVVIPPLSQLCVKVFAGWACDRITFISEKRKIQLFNSIAMTSCGLALLPLGFLPLISRVQTTQQFLALMFFTCSISSLGLVSCGSMKSVTLIARDYSHFVMAVVQLVVSVGMLTVPMVVNALVRTNTIREWRAVFFTVCMILIVCNLFFCRFCGAEMEPWAAASVQNANLHNANSDDVKVIIAPVGCGTVEPLITCVDDKVDNMHSNCNENLIKEE